MLCILDLIVLCNLWSLKNKIVDSDFFEYSVFVICFKVLYKLVCSLIVVVKIM